MVAGFVDEFAGFVDVLSGGVGFGLGKSEAGALEVEVCQVQAHVGAAGYFSCLAQVSAGELEMALPTVELGASK